MKTKFFLLFFTLHIGITQDILAQTPDDLYQTWHLYYTEADLGYNPMFYYGEDAPIITFNNDNTYQGIENCWEFNGQYQYEENGNDFPTLLMGNPNSDCVLGGSTSFTLAQIINLDMVTIISLDMDQLILEEAPGFIYEFRNEVTLNTEEFLNTDLKIFPNPATVSINIDYSGHIDQLEIYDVNGKLLVRKDNNYQLTTIENFQSGIYFAKIKGDLGIVTRRIIKK